MLLCLSRDHFINKDTMTSKNVGHTTWRYWHWSQTTVYRPLFCLRLQNGKNHAETNFVLEISMIAHYVTTTSKIVTSLFAWIYEESRGYQPGDKKMRQGVDEAVGSRQLLCIIFFLEVAVYQYWNGKLSYFHPFHIINQLQLRPGRAFPVSSGLELTRQ